MKYTTYIYDGRGQLIDIQSPQKPKRIKITVYPLQLLFWIAVLTFLFEHIKK